MIDAIDRVFRLRLADTGVREADIGQSRAHELRVDHQDVINWQ